MFLDKKKNIPNVSRMVKGFASLMSNNIMMNYLSQDCFAWKLGNGETVYFWEDVWTEGGPIMAHFPGLYRIAKLKHITVKAFLELWELGNSNENLWNRKLFARDNTDLELLSNTISRLVLSPIKDSLIWIPGKGTFSTKACTSLIWQRTAPGTNASPIWHNIWSMKVPPKIVLFLWKVQWLILPTKSLLSKRMQNISPICTWCQKEEETINHLFWECEIAGWVWDFIGKWWSMHSKLSKIQMFSLGELIKCQRGGEY